MVFYKARNGRLFTDTFAQNVNEVDSSLLKELLSDGRLVKIEFNNVIDMLLYEKEILNFSYAVYVYRDIHDTTLKESYDMVKKIKEDMDGFRAGR